MTEHHWTPMIILHNMFTAGCNAFDRSIPNWSPMKRTCQWRWRASYEQQKHSTWAMWRESRNWRPWIWQSERNICMLYTRRANKRVYYTHYCTGTCFPIGRGCQKSTVCVIHITLAWFGWWAWVSARGPVHHCVQLEATMSCPTSLCQSFRCSCTLQGRLWLRQQLRRTGSV